MSDRRVLIVVMDGVGAREERFGNAVQLAWTPAMAWLKRYGDPYRRVGSDRNGRVSIDWGVYGVPETFVVDRRGRIAFKHVGPMMPEDMHQRILPLVRELQDR